MFEAGFCLILLYGFYPVAKKKVVVDERESSYN